MKKLTKIDMDLIGGDGWDFQIWVNHFSVPQTEKNFGFETPEAAFVAALKAFEEYEPPPSRNLEEEIKKLKKELGIQE